MVWPNLFWVEWMLLTCYLLGFYNYFAIRNLLSERKNTIMNLSAGYDALSYSEMQKKESSQDVA